MDIEPTQATQPISDDQELAQALAGVVNTPDPEPMQFEETSAVPTMPTPDPAPAVSPAPATPTNVPTASVGGDDNLPNIKKDAIDELRPLVDKLNLPADEKFDAYLLLIRSTDDRSLIAPAHEAAQAITDETRRAEALLDIIKEIDYLSSNDDQNQAA